MKVKHSQTISVPTSQSYTSYTATVYYDKGEHIYTSKQDCYYGIAVTKQNTAYFVYSSTEDGTRWNENKSDSESGHLIQEWFDRQNKKVKDAPEKWQKKRAILFWHQHFIGGYPAKIKAVPEMDNNLYCFSDISACKVLPEWHLEYNENYGRNYILLLEDNFLPKFDYTIIPQNCANCRKKYNFGFFGAYTDKQLKFHGNTPFCTEKCKEEWELKTFPIYIYKHDLGMGGPDTEVFKRGEEGTLKSLFKSTTHGLFPGVAFGEWTEQETREVEKYLTQLNCERSPLLTKTPRGKFTWDRYTEKGLIETKGTLIEVLEAFKASLTIHE